MEPKSGKLHKLSSGIFGTKWTEKWVHLDGTLLKCFPMAEQQVFSLASSRQSSSLELMDYRFVAVEEKKVNRKFAFQLDPKEKALKSVVFACSSEKEWKEWKYALTARLCLPADSHISPVIAEKIRRAAEAFTEFDPRRTDKLEVGRLRGLLRSIGWTGDESELSLMQQQLDLGHQGVITRSRLLTWLQSYYCAQEVMLRVQKVQADRSSNQSGSESDVHQLKHPSRDGCEANAAFLVSVQLRRQERADWNEAYYQLLTRGDPSNDDFALGIEVASLLKDFREAAEALVQQVIAEMALDDSEKTLKPQSLYEDQFLSTDDVPQQSGLPMRLRKYHRSGLLVYIHQPPSRRGSSQDKQQQWESALALHKVFGHQLRAARAIHDTIQEGRKEGMDTHRRLSLQVPLQCIVDHFGFRAYVVASLQGRTKSTRHGLKDQLKSHSREMTCQLKDMFDTIGLLTDSLHDPIEETGSPRELGDTIPGFFPRGAGFDVEFRHGMPTVTLQNLGDLFPADVSSGEPEVIAQEFVVHKMRPEFVRKHGVNLPLHSNTHLPLATEKSADQVTNRKSQLEAQLLQQSAISARECLVAVIIPEFVADLENAAFRVPDSRSLTHALHGAGINVRYLGLCYELASTKHVRRMLLAEMVARACKTELKASLCAMLPEAVATVIRQAKTPRKAEGTSDLDTDEDICLEVDEATTRVLAKFAVQEEAKHITAEFLNLVFDTSTDDTKTFWEERILPQVQAKFDLPEGVLTLDAIISEDQLHLPQLFHAIQAQISISLGELMNCDFKVTEPLALECIESISPITKLLARTTRECERQLVCTDAPLAAHDRKNALLSIMFQLSILDVAPDDERTPSVCLLLAAAAEISLKLGFGEQSEKLATQAIEDGPRNHASIARAFSVLMKLKHLARDLPGVQREFEEALEPVQWHLGLQHPVLCDLYVLMAEILCDLGETEKAITTIKSCVVPVRDCFGKESLFYADVRRQQGMLMYATNPENHQEIIGVLEDALSVYEKHFQDSTKEATLCKTFAAGCCYLLANLQMHANGGKATETAYITALMGLSLRKEVLSANDVNVMASRLQLGQISQDMGESYRAIEYYKPALSTLKTLRDGNRVDQLRSITQTMLQLHLEILPVEKRNVVEKTAKRFSAQWSRFALAAEASSPSDTCEQDAKDPDATLGSDGVDLEKTLLKFVMTKLFQQDPIEYSNQLVDKTDLEFQDYRKQYNLNFAGTLRRESLETSSPQHGLLRSPSARFASFSGAGALSPPGSPRSPHSPVPSHMLLPASPLRGGSTPFNQLDCNFLTNANGDFTYGGQLAAILFLIDHPTTHNTTEES